MCGGFLWGYLEYVVNFFWGWNVWWIFFGFYLECVVDFFKDFIWNVWLKGRAVDLFVVLFEFIWTQIRCVFDFLSFFLYFFLIRIYLDKKMICVFYFFLLVFTLLDFYGLRMGCACSFLILLFFH